MSDLDNCVKVVVNCYDIVLSTPHCCKCDIRERYCVEEFVII